MRKKRASAKIITARILFVGTVMMIVLVILTIILN